MNVARPGDLLRRFLEIGAPSAFGFRCDRKAPCALERFHLRDFRRNQRMATGEAVKGRAVYRDRASDCLVLHQWRFEKGGSLETEALGHSDQAVN